MGSLTLVFSAELIKIISTEFIGLNERQVLRDCVEFDPLRKMLSFETEAGSLLGVESLRAQPEHHGANEHDSTQRSKLLHEKECEVFGDQAYRNESHRQAAKVVGIRQRINRRPSGRRPLSARQRWINRLRSAARLFTSFALANRYLLRHRLLLAQWS
jgi:hypothetical protein